MEKAYVDENYGRNLTLPADVPDAHTRALRALIRQKELALLLGAVGYRGFVSVEMARTDVDTIRRTMDYIAEVFA